MAYLVVLDYMGIELVELLGEIDFIMSGFEVELTLLLANVKGLGGGGGGAGALRGPIDSDR